MSKNFTFCNNCGKNGHVFHQCKYPITSIGIIAVRKNRDNQYEYLMIRRKDTLGYVDFMRGKYCLHNKSYISNIINEMTIAEKDNLLENEFPTLWTNLWGANIGIQYRSEERVSQDKFNQLKNGVRNNYEDYSLKTLIDESKTTWDETEWGFPKGRRNYQEKDLIAAMREFEEDAGYSKNALDIVANLLPLEEIFTGSNYKSYKHKYYLAFMDPIAHRELSYECSEVSKIEWKNLDDALSVIRPYNLEKINLLKQVNKILKEYTFCI